MSQRYKSYLRGLKKGFELTLEAFLHFKCS